MTVDDLIELLLQYDGDVLVTTNSDAYDDWVEAGAVIEEGFYTHEDAHYGWWSEEEGETGVRAILLRSPIV